MYKESVRSIYSTQASTFCQASMSLFSFTLFNQTRTTIPFRSIEEVLLDVLLLDTELRMALSSLSVALWLDCCMKDSTNPQKLHEGLSDLCRSVQFLKLSLFQPYNVVDFLRSSVSSEPENTLLFLRKLWLLRTDPTTNTVDLVQIRKIDTIPLQMLNFLYYIARKILLTAFATIEVLRRHKAIEERVIRAGS